MARQSRSLAVRGLSVSRGGRRVLEDVGFDANPGEICVIVGPNGAGKTTLLEALIGLLHADAGRVTLGAEPLSTFPRSARAFAYMPDEADLVAEATVRTILGSAGTRSDAVSSLAVDTLLDRRGDALSRGEAKRVWLTLALALARPVLVLDEPFGAFDPLQLDGVLGAVKRRAAEGTIVIASVHQMTIAERIGDRILLLAGGRAVACGTLDDLRSRANVGSGASLEETFRALLAHPGSDHAP